MCYIAFISYSLNWRYIKIALQEYVIKGKADSLSRAIEWQTIKHVIDFHFHVQTASRCGCITAQCF